MINITELSYSLHLGSDKNKKGTARNTAKKNKSGTTSRANNAIQNARGLSRVDNHNYRKYDNDTSLIEIIRGSSSIVDDVKDLYKKEFDKAKEEYNAKQTREDRKIQDYFSHISNSSKNDLQSLHYTSPCNTIQLKNETLFYYISVLCNNMKHPMPIIPTTHNIQINHSPILY